ncbi:alkane 1-monooxygenase [Massilia sp. TS11]|uniref:alkane 1-monooxygenase n=1 Tax=Massilia sp. TS11 TaxID=2908003 RepID=UPI001EDB3B70|nr:alkane 1-monooxygenase [Massilia sp. TS11]MCG2585626.1 alkane 1-monooxygenase [Massilia sp. TS11]
MAAFHYLKFLYFHLVALSAVHGLLAGGAHTTLGLAVFLAGFVVLDIVGGDDLSTPEYRHPGILTFQLWLALPILSLIVFTAVWRCSSGDPLGYGAFMQRFLSFDVFAARAANQFGHQLSAIFLTGFMIGMVGTITGHELTHRTRDRVSMLIGRWLLAFSFDTSFAVEHVYGHHRYVSTALDPATAPRGRNVYAHILRSTIAGNLSAWKIEAARLQRHQLPVFSWHNSLLRGAAMSATLVAIAALMGGWAGAAFFIASALWGKALLEIVNYIEHYGLVRLPGTPVAPRHSWNTNRRFSSWGMFNLTRHSHHHAQGALPYHRLRPIPEAPQMISGYLSTMFLAMLPPLWFRLMAPRLAAWDRDYATPEERALARLAEADAR